MRKAVATSGLVFLIYLAVGSLALPDDEAIDEPFGLTKSVAPEGTVAWQEWKKVIAGADAELQKLERCNARREVCRHREGSQRQRDSR